MLSKGDEEPMLASILYNSMRAGDIEGRCNKGVVSA